MELCFTLLALRSSALRSCSSGVVAFSRWGNGFTLRSADVDFLGLILVVGERPVSSDKLMLAGDERS